MGDYFNEEKEEETQEEEEYEPGKDEFGENLNLLQKIIKERNGIFSEVKEVKQDTRDRIGRLNLKLFGDPDNSDWVSSLDELEEEAKDPMTRIHPISRKTLAVVSDIKEFQKEYNRLERINNKFVEKIGKLLDYTIKEYRDLFQTCRIMLEKKRTKEEEVQEEPPETNEDTDERRLPEDNTDETKTSV